jgi:hypothetical protein
VTNIVWPYLACQAMRDFGVADQLEISWQGSSCDDQRMLPPDLAVRVSELR